MPHLPEPTPSPVVGDHVAVLLLPLRSAPRLPAPLRAQALALAAGTGDEADAVLVALLDRPEVSLAELPSAGRPGRHPRAQAAYLSRPEHDPQQLAALVAGADPRVLRCLVELPHPGRAACAAAVAASPDPELLAYASGKTRLTPTTRAAAFLRAWALAATDAEPSQREELRRLLDRQLRVQIADELAVRTTDPQVLAAVAARVRTADAADAVIEHLLLPTLTGAVPAPDTGPGWFDRLDESALVARYASAAARERLAAAWEGLDPATLPDNPRLAVRHRDVIALVRGAALIDRPLAAVRRDLGFDRDLGVELAALLTRAFGEDATCWAVYPTLAAGFTGTVAELIAAVRAVAETQRSS